MMDEQENKTIEPLKSQMSNGRRWIIFFICLFECLVFGGVIFGFAQLLFVLKREGIYAYLCHASSNETELFKVKGCQAQDEKFAFIYTIACTTFALPGFIIGYMLHYLGLAFTRITASLIIMVGFICMGLTTAESSDWLIVGMILTGIGGNQLGTAALQVANLFPKYRSTALSVIGGAFSASAGVFLFIQLASDEGISLRTSCFALAALSTISIPATMFLPCHHVPFEEENDETKEEKKSPPLRRSFCSFSSFLFFSWFAFTLLGVVLFSTYFNSWISRIADDLEEAGYYSYLFSFVQFFCPLVPPLFGLLTDLLFKCFKSKSNEDPISRKVLEVQCTIPATVLVTLSTLVLYVCLLFDEKWAFYVGLGCLLVSRPSIIAIGKPFMRTRYPPDHFNRMIGIFGSVNSVFNLLQYAHFIWSQENYYLAQGVSILFLVLSFLHPLHLLYKPYITKLIKEQEQFGEGCNPENGNYKHEIKVHEHNKIEATKSVNYTNEAFET